MSDNISTIRELYAAAEGDRLDLAKFLSCFAKDAYVRNVPAETEFRGEDITLVASGMADAFPDIHREIFDIYRMGNAVVVELAIRGTHKGALETAGGTVSATGRAIDVPCCDVFQMEDGKVISFHCYNAATLLLQQLGLTESPQAA
ncbi:nuclear transport factor 2 family protein [Rhizobium halophytocola]|uniref:Ketosteroid isomerase-like protein n=1 Tax=Rhizobium halophytocola TaxID=735519 RepID=A0ABS4DYL8_9HYPH|nr:nuclear transport factor 2 family protein [Rhizobium halophytocola]MBP1850782.1 ketosteroid isomerase-like protein [Rhizobium halophytocola]